MSIEDYKESIVTKLDLDGHVKNFSKFFAREKSIIMQGDINQHYRYVESLAQVEFPDPVEVPIVDGWLARLRKQAILSLDELYVFVNIVEYFRRLKSVSFQEPVSSWIHGIDIPDEILEVTNYFTDDAQINPELDTELRDLDRALSKNKQMIKDALYKISRSSSLSDYLVDTQIHLQNSQECLLVRGGFSNVLKATVIGRSSGGFFYIVPSKISELKDIQSELVQKKEQIIWRYCRDFSAVFYRWERFLNYINNEYDKFDHYQARVNFAKAYEYEFVLPSSSSEIILENFAHPAISDCVPISLSFNKKIMLVTGVNAGGKTMLLKSILSAVYMSKYLLPFRCTKHKTKIGKFKNIEAIIDDPQSVKNDISTFAGRMQEFSRLFRVNGAIVGVDEIELGTDADEAAALFKVMLEDLKKRGNTFIVTTHHKRLASLMAEDDDVELVAALYDEERRLPTYRYLQGSIGKSYAFETAQRYGISTLVIEKAKEFFGEDKERLGELIEKSTTLEREMRQKIKTVEAEREKLEKKRVHLESIEEKMQEEQRKAIATLENRYNAATKRAKQALNSKDSSDGRRLLNEAHKHKIKAKPITKREKPKLKVGDNVKYRSHRGEVMSIKAEEAVIVVDGLKMRVPMVDLKLTQVEISKPARKEPKVTTRVQKSSASVSIKLLGMYGDEAIEKVDKFISDAMLHGLNEVEIIHGTGGGILARLVAEYLREHPKIDNFYKVPGNMGATIVEL